MAPALQLIAVPHGWAVFSALGNEVGVSSSTRWCAPGKRCSGKLPEGDDDCELRDKQMPAEEGGKHTSGREVTLIR